MSEAKRFIPLHQRLGYLKADCYRESKIVLNDGFVIRNKRRYLKKSIEMNNCIAYDTETYKGFCKLLADSKGRYIYQPTFKECLDFLFSNSKYTKTYHFWYNIDFDISAIFKLARNDFSSLKEFNIFMRSILDGFEVVYDNYKIKWIKEKLFILKKDKKIIRFTDLNSFLQMKLDKAIKDYVDKKQGKDKIDGNKLNTDLKYWSNNLDNIIKYCIKDCKLTERLGLELIKRIKKADIELPRMLVSSASLSKQNFRLKCHIPSIHFIPKEVLQASYNAYGGGRFEIFKRGYFPEVYLYDIVSEYPAKIKDLPSLKYGKWLRVNELNEKETLGFYKARIFIPPEIKISPAIFREKSVNLWINGYQENWFTWYDLDLMRDYIIEIVIGYEYKPNSNEYYPYKYEIERLSKLKAEYKESNDKMMVLPVKLTMNALYGTNYEKHEIILKNGKKIIEGGILFNPVYASIITAYGRWRLMKDVKKKDYKHLLAFHTDSIIIKKKLEYLDIGNELGQWNLEAEGQCLILNTGVYQIADVKCKTRGVPKKYIKNWWIFAYNNRYIVKKTFKHKKMIKIREALKQDKNLARLNIMDNVEKSIDINSDKKRSWYDDFYNFDDLLERNIDSLPHFNHIDIDANETLIKNPLLYKDFQLRYAKV